MKKLILFLLLFVGLGMTNNTHAQDYKSAVGLRLGVPTSISYKTFLNETSAIEVFGGFGGNGSFSTLNVNAGYLLHNDFPDIEKLKWYYGAGAGIAFYDGGTALLINGFIGLEYTLEEAPLTFSVDWVPSLGVIGSNGGFGAGRGAIAVRYILDGASF